MKIVNGIVDGVEYTKTVSGIDFNHKATFIFIGLNAFYRSPINRVQATSNLTGILFYEDEETTNEYEIDI